MARKYTKTKIQGVFKEVTKYGLTYVIKFRDEFGITRDKVVGKSWEGFTLDDAYQALKEKREEKKILVGKIKKPKDKIVYSKFQLMADKYFEDKEALATKENHVDIKEKQYKTFKNISREKSTWRNFWAHADLVKVNFSKVNEDHVLFHMEEMKIRGGKEKKGYSQQTCYNAYVLANSIFKHAKENRLIPKTQPNPFYFELEADRKRFSRPKNKSRKRFLAEEEAQELINYIAKFEKVNDRDFCIAMLSLVTGARPQSILTLKVEDFNLKIKQVRLFDFKRKKFFNSNLNTSLVELLKEQVKGRDGEEYIFYYRKPLVYLKNYPVSVKSAIKKLFNEGLHKGEEKVVPYTFRHTFSNILIHTRNVPIDRVSRALNHATVTTTEQNYLTRDTQEMQEDIEGLGEMFMAHMVEAMEGEED